jgi:hypothetical protein
MSTTPPSTKSKPVPPSISDQREIRIYAHSQLFYWWPVWATAFILSAWTWVEGHRMVIVPSSAKVAKSGDSYVVTSPSATRSLLMAEEQAAEPHPFRVHTSDNSRLGAIFVSVLLLVILITNAPLRGVWSIAAIITLGLLAIIFALAEWWEPIFRSLGHLHIYINMAGYLFIGGLLFLMWLVGVLIFDRQTYMIFTPGQLKVCLEIGGGETAYDTMGMTIQKQRDDLFRHWILGLGSGDLIVRTSGANSHEFHMPNVLNVSYKLRQIEEMQRDRPTVQG